MANLRPLPTGATEDQQASSGSLSSIDLVGQVQARNPRALSHLYREHHAEVRRLAFRLLGRMDDAEDLLQEVFLEVPDALRRYRGDCSLRSFLLSIAVKKASKVRRRWGRVQRALRQAAPVAEASGLPGAEAIERRQLAAGFAHALAQLPFRQRSAVVLCLVEERSAVEAAGILGIPASTVRTRVFYGREQLRRLLQDHR